MQVSELLKDIGLSLLGALFFGTWVYCFVAIFENDFISVYTYYIACYVSALMISTYRFLTHNFPCGVKNLLLKSSFISDIAYVSMILTIFQSGCLFVYVLKKPTRTYNGIFISHLVLLTIYLLHHILKRLLPVGHQRLM